MIIKYHGKASHAAVAPWDGNNALDAAVMCYQAISNMGQQIKPDCRVHGTIFSIQFTIVILKVHLL